MRFLLTASILCHGSSGTAEAYAHNVIIDTVFSDRKKTEWSVRLAPLCESRSKLLSWRWNRRSADDPKGRLVIDVVAFVLHPRCGQPAHFRCRGSRNSVHPLSRAAVLRARRLAATNAASSTINCS